MWSLKLSRIAALCGGVAALAAALPAAGQALPPPPVVLAPPPPGVMPPLPSPEASEIAACLCLRQAVDALGADMTARKGAYDASLNEVGALDAQLQSVRASLDVNNPQAVAGFRQLLDRRDAAFRRSSGATVGEYSSVVGRYNSRANEYNARCANTPRNPVLLSQVQATLTCPPSY